ncbi:MAG: tetratricopeptide repeat protein, partial [Planctomycetota bacterium]
LTNLAKVHSNRGNETLAESTLWRALELDPNQDNGLQWFATIHNDREGKSAMIDAFRRVAELPKSWRARLWIAREELESNNLISAKKLYKEAISLCDNPIPADLLMQMTGDLGNNGHLDEIISLAEPYFDPSFHGLQVGNNLIKANLDLSNFDNAKIILDALYTQNRPDWQETLSFWDTEIAKVRLSSQNKAIPDQHSCSLVSIEGPLWARDGSLFSSVLPKKHSQATRFAIIGSTALLSEEDKRPNLRLSDPPGRLSRAIPLFLAEQLCIRSDSVATALIPWIQDTGFALFGRPYNDQDLCALAEKNEIPPDYSVSIVLDAVKPIWKINAYLLDQKNKLRLAETSIETSTNNLGPSTELLINNIIQLIIKHTNTNEITCPSWYQVPAEEWSSDYLLRLEQQLAVACMNLDFLKGGDLSGEHEILNGCLWLCKSQPDNSLARIILVQMLCQMKKIRPNIVIEYKDKVIDLHHEHPLKTDLSELIEKTLTGVFES